MSVRLKVKLIERNEESLKSETYFRFEWKHGEDIRYFQQLRSVEFSIYTVHYIDIVSIILSG